MTLSSGFSSYAAFDCSALLARHVAQGIGQVSHDRSSFMKINLTLVPPSTREMILQKTLKDFGSGTSLRSAHFFSQFTIDDEGRLHTINDPTVVKDAGDDIARHWEQDAALRSSFAEIYRNTKMFAEQIRLALPEAEVELAEIVFTLQVNKVPESWHLDWYEQEYLIATQTFLAKKLDSGGKLVDEDLGGTEYLLFGDIPEVRQAILESSPKKIEFTVNMNPPIGLVGKGFHYLTPTHLLSMHSGVSRVNSVLGITQEAEGFNLVSPPHRGSYSDLVIRGSLAIRFRPKITK
jgi:hypothetical protein